MPTTIHEAFAVNIQGISSATAVGNRTYTTTRPITVMDMHAYKDATAVTGAAATLTLSNGASTITSVATPNPPVVNTIYRLGAEVAASTCDDAQQNIASGGSLIFAVSTADTFDFTAIFICED